MPSPVVTFLLTDLEGSTRLWEERQSDAGVLVDRHEAIIKRPHEVSTRVGKFGELVHAVAPGMHHLIMSGAYHMLPDTAGKREDGARPEQPVTPEAYALGMLMRGIHL